MSMEICYIAILIFESLALFKALGFTVEKVNCIVIYEDSGKGFSCWGTSSVI